MRLNELFSPIGAPEENQDVNWLEDLKFFMNNDNDVTSNVMFPAIKKHKKYAGHPDAYKIYIKPIQKCKEMYCTKFGIDDDDGSKFTKETLINMARSICGEQEKFIERGDYEN
tara:strand:- start:162 stop:500 length:339 start_codon:yes stop_codon:yes gene_type:complete